MSMCPCPVTLHWDTPFSGLFELAGNSILAEMSWLIHLWRSFRTQRPQLRGMVGFLHGRGKLVPIEPHSKRGEGRNHRSLNTMISPSRAGQANQGYWKAYMSVSLM